MEPVTIGWIMILGVIVLLLSGLPVAFAMFIAGAIGHILLVGLNHTIASIPIIFYDKMSTFTLGVIPLFILMGLLASAAGFADDAFDAGKKWVGRFPGSLAQATIAAGTAFGAACGTTIAACAAFARIAIPPMREAGVDEKLAIGAVAAAAPLSAMIPPSVLMPLYGVITDTPMGKLLIAGLIPGIVAATVMMLVIFIMVKVKPELAPPTTPVPWRERFASLKGLVGILVVFILVLGSIYTGVITPTEAGAVGALGALVVGLVTRRLKWRTGILPSLIESAKLTSSILIICVCAIYFSHFLALSRVPYEISTYLVGLEVPGIVILIGALLINACLGCIMDTLSILLLTMPIIFPAILSLGYDPIWFGVLMVQMAEIGALTPPFGLNLFVLRGSLPDVTMGTIIRSVIPFIGMYFLILAIYIAFPQIALWLPSKM